MWLMRIIGDCPQCGAKDSYGNVAVRRDHVLRHCKACRMEAMRPLPEIQKKVLYLDQFFFSHAFRGREERFLDAIARVQSAAHLQLLVAPYSSVHEEETRLWRGYNDKTSDELMEFIRLSTRGAKFERDYALELTQILKGFQAFLDGGPAAQPIDRGDAIEGTLDAWEDYLFVDMAGYGNDVEQSRKFKDEALDELVAAVCFWATSKSTFAEDVETEYRGARSQYINDYFRMVERFSQGDTLARMTAPLRARILEEMLLILPTDMPVEERLRVCGRFLASDHFSEVPFEWLWARLFATFKSMVRRGAFAKADEARRRLTGLIGDLTHISRYAPYCDAFVMDMPMAELVRQPTVQLQKRYGVKVFSLNNWDEFLAWLSGLEANMSDEHRAGVEAAYPSS